MNWRKAYQESVERWKADLRQQREQGLTIAYDVGGKTRLAYRLTEDQIAKVAAVEAEKDLVRAINRHHESEKRKRIKKGLAL